MIMKFLIEVIIIYYVLFKINITQFTFILFVFYPQANKMNYYNKQNSNLHFFNCKNIN